MDKSNHGCLHINTSICKQKITNHSLQWEEPSNKRFKENRTFDCQFLHNTIDSLSSGNNGRWLPIGAEAVSLTTKGGFITSSSWSAKNIASNVTLRLKLMFDGDKKNLGRVLVASSLIQDHILMQTSQGICTTCTTKKKEKSLIIHLLIKKILVLSLSREQTKSRPRALSLFVYNRHDLNWHRHR